ncbi:MAG: threonylcarbamoyladenosine tRNA methylthiotransferase MtaB [Bacteriovoracaceae bacterium]|jgi:threonylcarbamoyladenosine tRNA methylthiotransferase MtaB
MSKTVSFHTLGCRLNMSETGSIAQGFVDRGYKVVGFGESSDVTFLNTCTVTDGADSTCRNLIRKAYNSNPEGKVVVAGCYAQMEAEKIKKMQGVDLILGTHEKYKVFEYLDDDEDVQVRIDKSNEFWGASTTEADSHTRAFLKIQDGCNYVCSFCIIPFARGRSRTITVDNAINEAKKLVDKGFKEVILTGVNIGEYESTSGEKLVDLVKGVIEVEGLERLRLSSVEPNTITPELLQVLKDSGKYQDHFHIPMQSGCDDILTSMRRKYDVAFYKKTIALVKSYFPDASIGADIIVGYPGETDEQFMATFNLAKDLPLTHFHVFPYSKRKNTTAAKVDNHIQGNLKKERVKTLINLGEQKLSEFTQKMLGRESEVLFEREKDGYFHGYTSNYIKVRIKSDENLKNKILKIKLDGIDGTKVSASVSNHE